MPGLADARVQPAAASAVASRHFARPNSSPLGLIGAGALAGAWWKTRMSSAR